VDTLAKIRTANGKMLSKNLRDVLPTFMLTLEPIFDQAYEIGTVRKAFQKTGQAPVSIRQALAQRRGPSLSTSALKIVQTTFVSWAREAQSAGMVSYKSFVKLYDSLGSVDRGQHPLPPDKSLRNTVAEQPTQTLNHKESAVRRALVTWKKNIKIVGRELKAVMKEKREAAEELRKEEEKKMKEADKEGQAAVKQRKADEKKVKADKKAIEDQRKADERKAKEDKKAVEEQKAADNLKERRAREEIEIKWRKELRAASANINNRLSKRKRESDLCNFCRISFTALSDADHNESWKDCTGCRVYFCADCIFKDILKLHEGVCVKMAEKTVRKRQKQ